MIGDEALDVYNAFTWDNEEDKVNIDKVLEQFEKKEAPKSSEPLEQA